MSAIKEKKSLTAWFLTKPYLSGFIVFTMLQIVIGYVVYQRYQLILENDRREMVNLLNVVHDNLEQTLKNASTAALTLALTINDEGTPKDFDLIGRQLIVSNPNIDAVQLVPDGVIRYVYPYESNKQAIGYNVLESPENRDDAIKSIAGRKLYFAGPLKLRQGGIGIIGRLPVFKNGKFWGFSGVVIRMETLMRASGISVMDDSKYYFQLSHKNIVTNKTEFFLPVRENFSAKNYNYVNFTDTDWKLYLIAQDNYSIFWQLAPVTVFGTTLSLLFGFLIILLLRKPAELQLEILRQTRRLLNSEIKFKAIFDQAAIGIAHIDSNTGNFLEVNEQYCKMLGYTPEEFKARNFNDITHPEDKNLGDDYMKDLRSGAINNFSIEKRYIHKNGNIVWVSLTVSPLWKAGERPTAQIGIAHDITIRKEAEQLVHETEARFKSLFDDSPVALWEEDFSEVKNYLSSYPELTASNARKWFAEHPEIVRESIAMVKINDINNECLKLHAPKTKEQLLGNLDALMANDPTDAFIEQLVAVVTGAPFIEMQTQIKDSSIGDRDIYLRWSVMRGYEESLKRVIISTEDITRQKEAERLITSSQQRIESLVNTIDGIVWECDYKTFEFTYVNKKAEEISGYPVSEWLNDPEFWANKIHPDDREWALDFCLKNSQNKSQYDFEYRMTAKNGDVIWMRDIVNVIRENGVPVSLKGIMIDISKTKQAENDLNETLELVNEQKKRLMNFSYIVSHNLRSHAANIQSIVTLIGEADSDEERDEMIGMLKTVSTSLNDTMIHLNDLVNVQTNVALAMDDLCLKTYADNALAAISDQIEAKNATVVNNIPSEVTVHYNPAYLESILLNLFSNAVRYSHKERKPVITADWITENGKNALRVTDNGVGIDMERYGDKIFGLYKTFHGNNDARGVGLFMTKSQIEAMGGNISVNSKPGEGTAFTVSFKAV
ncbi:MAG: PAS domain S-box protein [Flavobacterium sp.]|nr:MAG: PAS domain S-box protein [Flavobacterium sp.]